MLRGQDTGALLPAVREGALPSTVHLPGRLKKLKVKNLKVKNFYPPEDEISLGKHQAEHMQRPLQGRGAGRAMSLCLILLRASAPALLQN